VSAKPNYAADLREVVDHLGMEHCGFGHPMSCGDDPLPKTEDEVTPFIRRRTKLWLDTWVLPKLRRLLEREERRAELRAGKKP
jgi:hypothetical protein